MMAIYKLNKQDNVNNISPLTRNTFADCGVNETKDLQPALASCPSAIEEIAPNTLIISEEYGIGRLMGSNRRIDLLGVDKHANIVVIELKRTEEGGDAELQAIRYAAMMATVTFEDIAEIYGEHLKKQKLTQEVESDFDYLDEAKQRLLEHLDWEEPKEEEFGQQVKIVLASAGFSPELTTAVIWLNESGLDIRCVRLHPYRHGPSDPPNPASEEILLDIQTIIPLPETSDYQIARRNKQQGENRSRTLRKTRPKYDLQIASQHFTGLSGRDIVRKLLEFAKQDSAVSRATMKSILGGKHFNGERLVSDDIKERLRDDTLVHQPYKRFFHEDDEIFHEEEGTYIFSNQWRIEDAVSAANQFKVEFPQSEHRNFCYFPIIAIYLSMLIASSESTRLFVLTYR